MIALRSVDDKFPKIAEAMKAKIDNLLAAPPMLSNSRAKQSFETWKKKTRDYLAQFPAVSQHLREWNPDEPVPAYRASTSFVFGTNWITARPWQDWYGRLALASGRACVCAGARL